MGLVWPRSVDLKLERASTHIEELKDILGDYTKARPYKAVRDVETDPDPYMRAHRAVLDDEPPEILPVIIGDIVHNLRSALDHLAVSLVPPERAGDATFPVFASDPWELDPRTGKLIPERKSARQTWDRATRGMSDYIKEQIKRLQPYHHTDGNSPLGILRGLSNADKHSSFVAIGRGIQDPWAVITSHKDGIRWTTHRETGRFQDGAIVSKLRITPGMVETGECTQQMFDSLGDPNTEVDVYIDGTPKIGLRIDSDERAMHELPESLEQLHWWVEGVGAAFRMTEFGHSGTQ